MVIDQIPYSVNRASERVSDVLFRVKTRTAVPEAPSISSISRLLGPGTLEATLTRVAYSKKPLRSALIGATGTRKVLRSASRASVSYFPK